MTFRTCLTVLAAGAALQVLPAAAQEAPQPAQPPQSGASGLPGPSAGRPIAGEVGAGTRAILAIQREGTQAGALVPMTGEQAALGYQRYLDSFRFALPEFYTGQADATTVRAGSAGQPIGR